MDDELMDPIGEIDEDDDVETPDSTEKADDDLDDETL